MNILLTGANGYIGRRLLPVLVLKGHRVVCLVRDKRRIILEDNLIDRVEFFEADLLKPDSLEKIPPDLDVAFYLVHSMGLSGGSFFEKEENAARNFIESAKKSGIRQVIYLSGIVNDQNLSPHLKSRLNVEHILLNSGLPVTIFRAAIIIGSGGASFEIIRDLVEKLPVMVAPRWLNTRCQPIAIRNVIEYLEKSVMNEQTFNKIFDIGGPDILTYREMLMQFAECRGFRRWIQTIPVLTPRLSSYWLYFVTSTSFPLAKSLVDSMKNEVIVSNKEIRKTIPVNLISYRDAIRLAFDKIAQNEVVSSWKDAIASSEISPQLLEFIKIPSFGCFIDQREVKIEGDTNAVLQNIWSIGGEKGWYSMNLLWEVRGLLDKLVGGVGLRRGRRSPELLFAGDALDFWRVLVADKSQKRLFLYAEMKLPGEAWLEFKIKKYQDENYLVQTATFRPDGIWGRIYWYSLLPFHAIIFGGMAKHIASK